MDVGNDFVSDSANAKQQEKCCAMSIARLLKSFPLAFCYIWGFQPAGPAEVLDKASLRQMREKPPEDSNP